MLQLFADGQQIDTSGVKFNITLKNPMFTDGLKGSYIFNLSTPLSGRNKVVYGFPHLLDKHNNYSKDFDFRALFNGIELPACGKQSISGVNEKSVESNVKIALGDFVSATKEKTLKEIDLGGDYTFDFANDKNAYISNSIQNSYPDYKFVRFPVYNPDLYNGTSLESPWQNVNYINGNNPLGVPTPSPDLEVLFVYIGYIVRQIFQTFGFQVTRNPFETDEELKKLVLLNHYSDHLLETPTSFNLIDYIPPHNINSFLINLTNLFGSIYFINSITRQVEIKFLDEIIRDPDYIEFSDNIVDSKKSDLLPLTKGYFFDYKYDSKDILPKEKINKYDESFHTIIDPVISFSNLPDYAELAYLHKNEVCLVKNENAFYQLEFVSASNYQWLYFSENMYEYSTNDLKPEYKPEISPMMISKHDIDVSGATGSWLTTECRVPLFSDPDNAWLKGDEEGWENFRLNAINSFAPRICFYRGVRNKSTGTYPLGTYDIYDYDGNVIGSQSLKMEGDTGIFKNFWERYIYWYHNVRRPVTFKKLMTAKELSSLDFSKKYMIFGIKYYIKEPKIPVLEKEMGIVTIKCYKA